MLKFLLVIISQVIMFPLENAIVHIFGSRLEPPVETLGLVSRDTIELHDRSSLHRVLYPDITRITHILVGK